MLKFLPHKKSALMVVFNAVNFITLHNEVCKIAPILQRGKQRTAFLPASNFLFLMSIKMKFTRALFLHSIIFSYDGQISHILYSN